MNGKNTINLKQTTLLKKNNEKNYTHYKSNI